MKKYFSLTLFLVVALIFLSGCTGDLITPATENDSTSPTQTDGVGEEKGTLKIYLTDANGWRGRRKGDTKNLSY
jgi:ABC-type glycerol-3-phosphate transport system substrate-binding protein